MKTSALEKRNPEDDGMEDGKANAAANDFCQGLLHEKTFESHLSLLLVVMFFISIEPQLVNRQSFPSPYSRKVPLPMAIHL